MRQDLPLGVFAAMLLHAGGESSPGNLPEGTNAYVLAVPDEAGLYVVADRLRSAGLSFKLIIEPDPPWNGAAMAIGVEPGRKEVIKRALSSLPLLRRLTPR